MRVLWVLSDYLFHSGRGFSFGSFFVFFLIIVSVWISLQVSGFLDLVGLWFPWSGLS